MIYSAKTDKGIVRENNEDFLFVGDNLLIIADGMGGHNAGEVASRLAVETAVSVIEGSRSNYKGKIKEAVKEANKRVREMAIDDREGMGTTFDVCIYDSGKLYIGHIGDSRVYIIRDGKAIKITEDHSYVEMLVAKGEITKEEAANYPMKNMITRAIGVGESVECDFYETEIMSEDKVVLCTDGLTNMVREDRIAEVITREANLEEAVEILVKEALDAGGKDNITIIAAKNFD